MMTRLRDARRLARPFFRAEVVWLDGSKRPADAPIRVRWIVLSVPLWTVEWSRKGARDDR